VESVKAAGLKNSKDGSCEMLDCEFTVVDGEFAKRKFWQPLLLSGTTDGQAQAAKMGRGVLRAILESARNIKPDDQSEAAKNKRRAEFADFNNLRFIVRIGIEKSKDRNFPDKNKVLEVITPDQKQWKAVEQVSASAQVAQPGAVAAAVAKPAQAITRPEWAQ